MKKKAKMITAVSALAITSLLISPLHKQLPQEPPVLDTSPISAFLELGRGNASHRQNAKPLLPTKAPKTAPRTHRRTTRPQKPILIRQPPLTARRF